MHLRRTLLLPLDDLLAVTREFLSPDVSRSGLDRCLRRHGVGNLNALKPAPPQESHKAFKSYEPGFVHMDVKYLPICRTRAGGATCSLPSIRPPAPSAINHSSAIGPGLSLLLATSPPQFRKKLKIRLTVNKNNHEILIIILIYCGDFHGPSPAIYRHSLRCA